MLQVANRSSVVNIQIVNKILQLLFTCAMICMWKKNSTYRVYYLWWQLFNIPCSCLTVYGHWPSSLLICKHFEQLLPSKLILFSFSLCVVFICFFFNNMCMRWCYSQTYRFTQTIKKRKILKMCQCLALRWWLCDLMRAASVHRGMSSNLDFFFVLFCFFCSRQLCEQEEYGLCSHHTQLCAGCVQPEVILASRAESEVIFCRVTYPRVNTKSPQ